MKDYAAKIAENITINANGCHEWTGYGLPTGYGRTRYENKMVLVHRLAWMLAKGPIPKRKCVCHRCDNPKCCNVDHLFIGTHRQNMRDAIKKGRMDKAFGILAAISPHRRKTKITDAMVDEIRSSSESSASLAKRFGCTYTNVYLIRRGLRKIAPQRIVLD